MLASTLLAVGLLAPLQTTPPAGLALSTQQRIHDSFVSAKTSRSGVAAVRLQLEPRDPEVERATGGGWRRLLPNRGGLIAAGVIGTIAVAFPDSPIGQFLNEPPARTVKQDKVDDIGIVYGETSNLQPTGGLALIVGYQLFARVVRPKLREAAKEREEQQQQQEQQERLVELGVTEESAAEAGEEKER